MSCASLAMGLLFFIQMAQGAGEVGARTLKMWATDQIMDQDAIEVGFHRFKCPLLAVGAQHSWQHWEKLDELTPEAKEWIKTKATIGGMAQRIFVCICFL